MSSGASKSSSIVTRTNSRIALKTTNKTKVSRTAKATDAPQSISAQYNLFGEMDDDQKADIIDKLISQKVPDHLADNDFQKFIYHMGLNDKPELVDSNTLNTMNGTALYRTVNNVYDRKHDLSFTAKQIAQQVQGGKITRVSDSGGSAYGRGIYFADNLRDSTSYGRYTNDIKRTAVIYARLNSNAKVLSYHAAWQATRTEMASGSKLGKVLKKCDIESAVSIYSLSRGYNVLSSGYGYYNVLNRQALSIDKNIYAK